MNIRTATQAEYEQLAKLDYHISKEMLAHKINQGEVIVAMKDTLVIGWLRYGYFWDSIPYMNMLTVLEEYRGHGIGTQLIQYWENLLRNRGFTEVLTSTLANEHSQFLYRKLGYQDCGALILPDEPLEIILRKSIAPGNIFSQ
jgi:ribosomal protein S18 acetylase RimI-like enzyme